MHSEVTPESRRAAIAACHRILKLTTILVLGAFALIIISTTISTGPLVKMLGKGLYYVVLISAAVSLLVWLYRTWLERRLERDFADHKESASD